MTDIKRRFFDSLKRGTGETYLILEENPTVDFSTYIIKGALRNYAYDGQCESSRAQYIFGLYKLSNQKEKIRKAVLKGLTEEHEDTWSLTHLFEIAKLFALQSDLEMRNAIYDRFCNNPIEGSDWVGCSEILELDGLQGLIYIAEKFGKSIELNPDDWQDDWIIRNFQEENPALDVTKILEDIANENKFIRIYLDNIKRTKASQEEHKPETTKYKDIIDEVINSKPFISFVRKRKLSEYEVTRIAEQLIVENNRTSIEKLLSIFDYHKFPFDSEIILNYAKQKRSTKNRLVENAIEALKHLKSNSIREFALDKIQNSKNTIDYLEILVSNYQTGDSKLLSEIANNTINEHKIELLARIFTEIFEANKTAECKEPLEVLYNKMNCGIHRNGIIKILMENDVLSDKIRNEIKFDCDLDTRELIKNCR
jgi:hypothetical protein